MAEQPPPPANGAPRLCPVCGTRVGDAATKCFVCGNDLTKSATEEKRRGPRLRFLRRDAPKAPEVPAPEPAVPPSSEPDRELTPPPMPRPVLPPAATTATPPPSPAKAREVKPDLSSGRIAVPLPILIILIVVMVVVAGLLAFTAAGGVALFQTATPTVTATATTQPTFTPQPTRTPQPTLTPTPLPPVVHRVVAGETCISIAVLYDVSVQSILELNGFTQSCPLFEGQEIQVPQPTPTPEPSPTPTIPPLVQTQQAWPRHVVQPGESLSSIAAFYGIDFGAMAEVNGKLPPDYAIVVGEELLVPIDRPVPTAGPTPTPTAPPPYPAPNLLLPADGAAISAVEQTVTLQWTTNVTLRADEFWLVTVEDVTANDARRISDVTTTNRYVVNVDLKPFEASPHVFRWTVVAVRQVGSTVTGAPIYEPAGATSDARTFTWTGIGIVPTATPEP